jgi:hypothetical protein
MSFTPSIPTSGQTLGNSRSQVLNNFASLRTTISNVTQPNHIDVNDVGAGKHIFVEMPVQTPGAANLPDASEGGLITRTVNGNSELFYVRDAVNTYFQMTGPYTLNAGTPDGSITLFGGIILKWGTVPYAGGLVTFATPFLNNCFTAILTPVINANATLSIKPGTMTTTQLEYTSSVGGITSVCYIAIGN